MHGVVKTNIRMQYSCFHLHLEVAARMMFSKEDLAETKNIKTKIDETKKKIMIFYNCISRKQAVLSRTKADFD